MSAEQAYKLLYASYQAEVITRGFQPTMTEEIQKVLTIIAKNMTAEKPKCGICLCGQCGNGKTTVHYAFRNVLRYLQSEGFNDNDKDGTFGKEDLTMAIIEAKELVGISKDDAKRKSYSDKYLLGIEDVGNEPKEVLEYGNIINPFADILEHRYTHQLFTFFTTNLESKDFRERYGSRVADRLNEMMVVINLKSPSFRK